jgi:hypothetical protein
MSPTDKTEPPHPGDDGRERELDLDAIRRRCEAATEGPWATYKSANGWHYMIPTVGVVDSVFRQAEADVRFIAHAREDVPALIAEVERLRRSGGSSETEGATGVTACPVCSEDGTVLLRCQGCGEEFYDPPLSMAASRRYAREHPEVDAIHRARTGRGFGEPPSLPPSETNVRVSEGTGNSTDACRGGGA